MKRSMPCASARLSRVLGLILVASCSGSSELSARDFCCEKFKAICAKMQECYKGGECGDVCDGDSQVEAFGNTIDCATQDEWGCDDAADHAQECLDDVEASPCQIAIKFVFPGGPTPACKATACIEDTR